MLNENWIHGKHYSIIGDKNACHAVQGFRINDILIDLTMLIDRLLKSSYYYGPVSAWVFLLMTACEHLARIPIIELSHNISFDHGIAIDHVARKTMIEAAVIPDPIGINAILSQYVRKPFSHQHDYAKMAKNYLHKIRHIDIACSINPRVEWARVIDRLKTEITELIESASTSYCQSLEIAERANQSATLMKRLQVLCFQREIIWGLAHKYVAPTWLAVTMNSEDMTPQRTRSHLTSWLPDESTRAIDSSLEAAIELWNTNKIYDSPRSRIQGINTYLYLLRDVHFHKSIYLEHN